MVAKTTYVKKSGLWKVYWQRADMKWHSYDPMPEVGSLEGVFSFGGGRQALLLLWLKHIKKR